MRIREFSAGLFVGIGIERWAWGGDHVSWWVWASAGVVVLLWPVLRALYEFWRDGAEMGGWR